MIASRPRVSVIVPNYNHAKFLERRLNSIFNQTYQDFEVIILDDSSQDDSLSIIRKFANHHKIQQIILNEKNSGNTFLQWQRGLNIAVGELIWIAESDDFCEATFLETLVKPFDLISDLVVSFCQNVYIDENERVLGSSFSEKLEAVLDGKEFVSSKMLGINGIPNVSVGIFRKETFDSINRRFVEYRYCGDWYFWMALCLKGKVFISGKYLSYFTRHESNVSGRSEAHGLFFIEGNTFFAEFSENGSASEFEIIYALKLKINRYLETKSSMNRYVRKQVINSIKSLHKDAWKIVLKYRVKRTLEKLLHVKF